MNTKEPNTCAEVAAACLSMSSNGQNLPAPVRAMLQRVVAGAEMTEAMEIEVYRIYRACQAANASAGSPATALGLHGIPELYKDGEGYVYWKGQHVEHYSFPDSEREQEAAQKLADRCRKLEDKGFPVTARTAISSLCAQAPNTEWLQPLVRFYCFFEKEQEFGALFYVGKKDVMLQAQASDKWVRAEQVPYGAYDAFHRMQNAGWKAQQPPETYGEFVAYMKRLGLTPEAFQALLSAS